MPADFDIVRLTRADLPSNLALVQAVGWPDVEADWRVLHDASLVFGARRDGILLGQGALGVYGRAGTIAKMVVSPDAQRQGIGLGILDALLEEACARSIEILGLVATEFGYPLYARRDFIHSGDLMIHVGTATRLDRPTPLGPLGDELAAPAIEARFIGCSRESMLRARFREASVTSCIPGRGFAMATRGEAVTLIGPVIAETEDDARSLVSTLLAGITGSVRIDVPAEQVEFRRWLDGIGIVQKAVRPEMVRGAAALPWQVPQRFALATQAWG